jgi:NADH-quinone oxidoreductase subunit N
MMILVSAGSLLMVYLGLELLALCSYALVASNRENGLASEAAMKYIVLGSLASGLLLYGMSLIYGATGSLHLDAINAASPHTEEKMLLLTGAVFMIAGVAFKMGAAPFHMWLPDVYHGAPTAVTLAIGAAPQLAAFAILMRILVQGLLPLAIDWQQMLTVMAVVSIAVGNITAIAQTNIKRMLAYSTISQMGFMLLGL